MPSPLKGHGPRPILNCDMSPIRIVRHAVSCGAAFAIFALPGCKKAVAGSAATALVVVQGNLQQVQAGLQLPIPVVLRVTDASGAGIPAVPVTFAIGDGGGSVTPASIVSDTKGEVSVKWTLGPGAIVQSLYASAAGISPLKIMAFGILPSDIIIAQGNNQTAKTSATLAQSIVVRVLGGGNIPMVGVQVGFQVIGGGGGITPQSAFTNTLGEATAKWTMGTVPGINTAAVSASTLSAVTLTATATP